MENDFEALFFSYLDELKFLFFPEKWTGVFMDYSKNEIFTMLYLYRHTIVTMTEVADYMEAPLNTATGVVKRLEAREVVCRQRNEVDKRVVTVALTVKGRTFIETELREIVYYYKKFFQQLDENERTIALGLVEKAVNVLRSGHREEFHSKEKKKVRRIQIE